MGDEQNDGLRGIELPPAQGLPSDQPDDEEETTAKTSKKK